MEQKCVHEFLDLETGEVVGVLLTETEFLAYLRQTFGSFRMDDEERSESLTWGEAGEPEGLSSILGA